MNRVQADRLIAKLDNLEARVRDVEVGLQRVRHELQDEFMIKMPDYDPTRPMIKDLGE